MIDFLQLYSYEDKVAVPHPRKGEESLSLLTDSKLRTMAEDGGGSTTSSGGGSIGDNCSVYDQEAPLVAFTSHGQASMLKVFSLRKDKTVHVWRFNSAILKF